MLLDLKKTIVNESAVAERITAKKNADCQISLPDYCSDIKRILKCSVEPAVGNVSIKGEKITAIGAANVRLIYVSDEDKIDCYETSCDLSFSAEMRNPIDNALVDYSLKTDYINCRALSQRRVSVGAAVSICFTVYCENKIQSVCDCEGMGVELKKTTLKTQNLVCQGEKSFELTETVSLDNDKSDIGKILSYSGFCTVESKKAVSGKLLLKGELAVDLIYLADKEDNKICKLKHTMPISQIIDLPGISEKSVCNEKLKLCRLMVNVKADSAGKNRLVEIAAKASAFVKCTEIAEFECSVDCYSTDYNIEAKYINKEFLSPVMIIKEEKEARGNFELQKGASGILFANCCENSAKMVLKDGKAIITSNALISVFYLDEKGVPAFCEKNLDLDFEEKLPKADENALGEISCFLKNLSVELSGKESLEISATLVFSGEVLNSKNEKICTEISADENAKKKNESPALTVYFSDKGERVWDIAKKYNTTSQKIKDENGLTSDVISENKMLMIPAV